MFKLILFFTFLLTPIFANDMSDFYKFSFDGMDGDKINLSDYEGKVVLVVNTASKCGFTPQYAGLEELYRNYKDKGLVVLGVPSDNFMNQEFGSELEVKEFVSDNYEVTFPLTAITDVKGKNAHEFYKWAKNEGGFLSGPKWNFHKYLIDRKGDLVESFGSRVNPQSDKIVNAVERELQN